MTYLICVISNWFDSIAEIARSSLVVAFIKMENHLLQRLMHMPLLQFVSLYFSSSHLSYIDMQLFAVFHNFILYIL